MSTKESIIESFLNAPVIVSLISAVAAIWIAVNKNRNYSDDKVRSLISELKKAKEVIQKKEDLNVQLVNHFENMKVVIKIIYNQYEREFKDDPEKIQMLKEFREIIDFDPRKQL